MNDYISREDVQGQIVKAAGKCQIKLFDKSVNAILQILQNMPAADVQPVKHGRWVQYNRNGEETYIECTNCCVPSRPRHLQMVTRSGEGLPDYCPNCGARMDGDTNG